MAEKIKFSTNTRDGKELKLYIEGGACDGLKPLEVLQKFPQFQKYDSHIVRQALSRCRSAFKKKSKNEVMHHVSLPLLLYLISC